MKLPRNLKVYWDKRDWWVGYYRGKTHHYVCLLPSVVMRWDRKNKLQGLIGETFNTEYFKAFNYTVQASCPPNNIYMVGRQPGKVTVDTIMEAADRLQHPSTIYLHPNTKKYLDEITRLDIKKQYNGDGTVTFPIRTRRSDNE